MNCEGSSRTRGPRGSVEDQVALDIGRRGQLYFDARVVFVDVFIEMGFDDAVVVDPESLTEGILRDFEPAINVSPQG